VFIFNRDFYKMITGVVEEVYPHSLTNVPRHPPFADQVAAEYFPPAVQEVLDIRMS
jgi:hypothetical protein